MDDIITPADLAEDTKQIGNVSALPANALPDVTIIGAENKNQDGCIRLVEVKKPECSSNNVGFNLTRSQWDPYPWVKSVDEQSAAGRAGLREGDCLLRVNGEDLLGRKVSDIALLVKSSVNSIRLLVWSCEPSGEWDPEALVCGPLPDGLRRLSAVVASVLAALECPICCGTVKPPAAACPQGHLVCAPCRRPLSACPMCRTPYNHAQPIRNLLADEVYNSVVDAFELHGDRAKGKLTETLFGNAKLINIKAKSNSSSGEEGETTEFSAHDANTRGLKWGTQRLLQRLLPGRARSTGNIASAARSPTRARILHEERDISRSLSNLDIARCAQINQNSSNSLNSVACTTGGSYASLPPPTIISTVHDDDEITEYNDDEDTEDESKIQSEIQNSQEFHCPADPNCDVLIQGDVQKHILQHHNMKLTLQYDDSIYFDENDSNSCKAILHSTGEWFYPKFERDPSNEGMVVWCWTQGTSLTSSEYKLGVEVWSENPNKEVVVECESISKDDIQTVCNTGSVKQDKKGGSNFKKRLLLKLASPILSLKNVSWKRVINSKQGLFLGDGVLISGSSVKLSIDLIK